MQCPRCKTTDTKYFAKINGRYYCRRCIGFGRVFLDEKIIEDKHELIKKYVSYSLKFALSKAQLNLSKQLVENYHNHQNSVILAVCGSGKTEIVYEVIKEALNAGQKVCFCMPRKALVMELGDRIKKAFKLDDVRLGLFYGGHVDNLLQDFVICTTHQLFRFPKQFDLLILDEIDAFPYAHNDLLEDLLFNSLKGNYIFMSATLDPKKYPEAKVLILNRRYHLVALPIPQICLCKRNQILLAKEYLLKWHTPTLVYVPRIKDLDLYDSYLSQFHYDKVSSKTRNVDVILNNLKTGKLDFILTTTLLERGITIEDVQVIVLQADHEVFSKEVLIQIAGRVGRHPKYPKGEVIFISKSASKAMLESIDMLNYLNQLDV